MSSQRRYHRVLNEIQDAFTSWVQRVNIMVSATSPYLEDRTLLIVPSSDLFMSPYSELSLAITNISAALI